MPEVWRKRNRQATQVAVATLVLLNAGCLVVAAGAAAGGAAAGYAYYKGSVCRSYPSDFADVWAATQTALTDLGMLVQGPDRHANEGILFSRTRDGDKVRIEVQEEFGGLPAEAPMTRVCIRVATFGDESFSQRLLDQVSYHLVPATRIGPPAPPPPAGGSQPPQTAPPPLLPPEPIPITSSSGSRP